MGNCHAIPLTNQTESSATLNRRRRRRRGGILKRQRHDDNVSLPSSCSITSPTTTLEELRRIKIVNMGDGSILDVPNPIPVSHINDQNPNFLLCESASLRVGNRPCPLRPTAHLAPGHLYVLLPLSAFQRPLAWSYLDALASLISPPALASAWAPAHRPCRRRQVFPLPVSETSHHQVLSPPSSESSSSSSSSASFNIWSCDITTNRDTESDTDTSLGFHNVAIDFGTDDASRLLGMMGPDITMSLPCSSTIMFGDSNTSLFDASHPFNVCEDSKDALSHPFNVCEDSKDGLSHPFNVCEDSKDALSRYIEQLIERGNSWMPKLDTVEEEEEGEINSSQIMNKITNSKG